MSKPYDYMVARMLLDIANKSEGLEFTSVEYAAGEVSHTYLVEAPSSRSSRGNGDAKQTQIVEQSNASWDGADMDKSRAVTQFRQGFRLAI